MTKNIMQFRNIIIIALIAEAAIITGLYLITNRSVLLTVSIYSIVTNLIIIGCLVYLSYVIEDNNLSVKDALDSDSKNALLYGGIGLIQYDENRNIIWTSDLFKALNINIIGVKLLEWQPLLISLFDDEDVIVINIKGRKYEAYNNSESRLIYLKDVTQYVNLRQDYEDQQVVVAYITIDNYSETLENVAEPKSVSIQSRCRQVIIDWAYSNGIIVRRYRMGSYIAFLNERIYRKQVENNFEILDTFRNMAQEMGTMMSLSIGIGRNSRVLKELDEMATSALSITYSRGGDQVVIKTGGEENPTYFGGDSDASEKSNKVKARVISQTLAGMIKNSDRVVVMGHKFSDLDCFGASLGIAKMARSLGKKANIIVDFDSIEEKTRQVALMIKNNSQYAGLIASDNDVLELVTKNTLLIVIDNHKPSLALSTALLDKVKNKVVIDHHRRGEEFVKAPILTYIEPSASSSVEMVIELCEYQKDKVEFNELEATIMYAGMLVDTNYFKQHVGVRTFESAAKLKDWQADVSQAYEFLEDNYEATLSKLSLTSKAYRFNDSILISVGDEDQEYASDMLAKSSNALLEISDIDAAFTIGRIAKNRVAVSARSTSRFNVQIIMENVGGGGHFSMAAAQFDERSVEDVKEIVEDAILEYLKNRGEKK